jgi:hypothetical protein
VPAAGNHKNALSWLYMNPLVNHLDWMALLVGAIGSFLWAHNGPSAKYASVWWLCSSVLWIVFAWLHGLAALGARDFLGVCVTLYGCYRWLQPRKPMPVTT